MVDGTCEEHLVFGVRRVEMVGRHLKDYVERSCHETDILRTIEQNESQMQVRSVAGSEKQQWWRRRKVYSEREVTKVIGTHGEASNTK